jgi:hypothetical protein
MEMTGQIHAPAASAPGENPDSHWLGESQTWSGRYGEETNILALLGIEQQTLQSVSWLLSHLLCTKLFVMYCSFAESNTEQNMTTGFNRGMVVCIVTLSVKSVYTMLTPRYVSHMK